MFRIILSNYSFTDCYLRQQLLCSHDKLDFDILQLLVDIMDLHPIQKIKRICNLIKNKIK